MAAAAGDLEGVRDAVNSGAPVNTQNADGLTALMTASFRDRADVVEWLIAHGATVDLQDQEGQTALHMAVTGEALRAISKLHAGGARLGVADASGITPLMIAAQKTRTAPLEMLLEAAKSDPSRAGVLQAADANGWSALHFAASKGEPRTVAALLRAGTAVDPRDSAGRTPLWLAVEDRNLPVARLLVEAGARPSLEDAGGLSPWGLSERLQLPAMTRLFCGRDEFHKHPRCRP